MEAQLFFDIRNFNMDLGEDINHRWKEPYSNVCGDLPPRHASPNDKRNLHHTDLRCFPRTLFGDKEVSYRNFFIINNMLLKCTSKQ